MTIRIEDTKTIRDEIIQTVAPARIFPDLADATRVSLANREMVQYRTQAMGSATNTMELKNILVDAQSVGAPVMTKIVATVKGFMIDYREQESATVAGMNINLDGAREAAQRIDEKLHDNVIKGDAKHGLKGITTVSGTSSVTGDTTNSTALYNSIVDAVKELNSKGYHGKMNLLLNPLDSSQFYRKSTGEVGSPISWAMDANLFNGGNVYTHPAVAANTGYVYVNTKSNIERFSLGNIITDMFATSNSRYADTQVNLIAAEVVHIKHPQSICKITGI